MKQQGDIYRYRTEKNRNKIYTARDNYIQSSTKTNTNGWKARQTDKKTDNKDKRQQDMTCRKMTNSPLHYRL